MKTDKLLQKLIELKTKLDIELERENTVLRHRGWGYAQRHVKIGFSTRRSDALKERISKINLKLNYEKN